MLKSHALTVKLAIVLAIIGTGSALAATPSHASEGTYKAHAVGLGDATTPPTYLVYLYPHGSVTYAYGRQGYNCPRGGYFTDVSAYTWQGYAIGAQKWNARTLEDYWRTPRHGRVTFDGITFRNRSNHYVLVAGWCDRH